MPEQEYMEKYEENQKKILEQLQADEQIKHCLDKTSFNARFYNPCWLVTSEARIFSLHTMDWLDPYQDKDGCGCKNAAGEYLQKPYFLRSSNEYAMMCCNVKSGLRIYIHQLVANYFCDKTVVKEYGEENCEVHHIIPYNYERSCTENNRAANLQYVEKEAHREATKLSTGKIEGDALSKLMANTVAAQKKSGNAGVEVVDNGDGFKMKVLL